MKNYILILTAVSSMALPIAQAGEIGHYNGGIMDIRDYFLPAAPGIYGAVYNYYYFTTRLNNSSGDKISSFDVNTPGGPVPVNVGVDLHMYAVIPAIIWSTPLNFLGARYGGYIAPSFANNSLEANLDVANTIGGSINNSSFGVGDLFVQPVWLDWSLAQHFDLSLAYGFYAPVGKYNTQTVPLPGGTGTVTVGSKNNIGLGYWTQQAQGGIAWYPWTNKATAVTAVGTYEYNSWKRDINLRPGQMVTLNWGISQYLPLCPENKLLLEVGPAGYDSWQITDSTGSAAVFGGSRSQVHGVGGQVGLTYVPWGAFITFHGFYEYAAESRFQGASIGLNLGIKF